ncbi:MAG: GlxA family transcriptional regulator [Pseudomonadota bacterium]
MDESFLIVIIATPRFNAATTMQFIDPFRAANYLDGAARFRWRIVSVLGGPVQASNGASIVTEQLQGEPVPDLGVISSSWTPEESFGAPIDGHLRRWSRFGAGLAGLDTGAFVLADAGLLSGHRATVHYEHIDGFAERYPDVTVTEDLYVIDGQRMSCSGGSASTDLALHIVAATLGPGVANASARYIFHEKLRAEGSRQLPDQAEPLGPTAPPALRIAIQAMEEHLETPISLPEIAAAASLSLRQLERLFKNHVGKSPQGYYTKIRLDRARSLITQTNMTMQEVALAAGFSSPEHFSRAYRGAFGISPKKDRTESRLPFEFRAWPMHPQGARR